MIRILAAFCFLVPGLASAAGVYKTTDEFLAEAFPGERPRQEVVWLTGEVGRDLGEALGRRPATLRMRYWRRGTRTAWILDEIGKDKPITTGVVVDGGAIRRIEVLAFRESRGWEIRLPAFTRQFIDVDLTADRQLDRHIDGITGATLSVRAMKKMARAALVLDAHVQRDATLALSAR